MQCGICQRYSFLMVALLIAVGCGKKGAPVWMTSPSSAQVRSEATSEEAASQTPGQPEQLAQPEPSESSAPASSPAGTDLVRDTFADAGGSIQWNRDGAKSTEGPPGNRTVYFFNGMPEGGSLVMRIIEDGATAGPDGQPGVLALSWQELPSKLPYSGFAYLGGRVPAERLELPPLKRATSADDLRPVRLQFRYKGVSENREGPFQLTIGCRLEPLLTDSYAKRLDLGTLAVTGDWSSFDMSLGDGQNAEAFLRAVGDEKPAGFKILWAQAGPLMAYRPGDTLLIDDVVITTVETN